MLKNRLLKKQRLKKKVSSSSTVSGKKKNKSSFPKKNKNKKLSSSGSLVKKGGSGKAKKAAPGKNKKASFSLKQKEKKQKPVPASGRKKEKKSLAKLRSSTSKTTNKKKTTSQKNTRSNKKKNKTLKTAPSKKISSTAANKKVKPSPSKTKKEEKRSSPSKVSKKETISAKKKKTKTFNENDIIEEALPSRTVDEEEMDDEEVNVDIDPSVLVGEDAQVTDDDEEDEENTYIPKKSTPSMIKGKVRPLFEEKNIPKPKWTPPKEEIKKPIQKKEDNRTRYSDKELAEFKAIILQKLEEARSNYQELKAALTHSDAHGTEDTHANFKLMEDGSETMTREEIAQLAARQEKFIKNLENALIRIENKTYGICRVTGKLIPKERLRLVPHATLSIEAKEKLNR